MAITIKHKKVSTIPDADDTSLVRPSDWNDTHDLTGTIPVANGGTGADNATDARTNLGAAASGANSDITSMTGITGGISSPDYIAFDTTYASPLTTGQLGWDGNNTLGLGMSGGNITQEIGLQTYIYGKASSAITKGQLIKKTGANGSSGVITFAPTTANMTNSGDIIGIAAENIALNDFGYIISTGNIKGFNTTGASSGETWLDGDTLYYNPSGNGLMTKVKPSAPNLKVEVAIVINAGSGGSGSVAVEIIHGSTLGGTDSNVQITSASNGNVLTYDGGNGYWKNTDLASGTGISITKSVNGVLTITNSSPNTYDPTNVAITGGSINGTTIGATTASTGKFTSVTNTGLTSSRVTYATTGGLLTDASNFTYDGINLTAGAIQNTPIGSTTPAAGTFTTITGQTARLNGTGSNLIRQSQTIGTLWNQTGTATATINNFAAPDGTITASLISNATDVGFAGNSINQLLQTSTGQPIVGNTTYTFSVYIRAGTATTMQIAMRDNSTGSLPTFTLTPTTTWQRISVSLTTGASTTTIYAILGGANGTFYAWGAQVEYGSTANTYIPTTTTAVYGTPTLSFSGVSTIGLQSDGSLFVQPAGTGAIQAQATTSSATGGNARGANAVDWQTNRGSAGNVASAPNSVLVGGTNNTVAATGGSLVGGGFNTVNGNWSFIGGGNSNTVSSSVGGNTYGAVVGGRSNTAGGAYNFIGCGFTNSGTATAAVTTQSGTMNGTTAVTLSGSNANIRVGQYITGTSIAIDTYVAAISGTSLTLSQAASGSSTSTLSFFTPHGVVVGGGNNQATGAYSFIGGGGDAGTAANRNVASGDWSFVGGGRGNQATGIASTVGGGGFDGTNSIGNTASNTGATVVGGGANLASNVYATTGGRNNVADGNRSTVWGNDGTARSVRGIFVMSACQNPIGGNGVSQSSLLILGKQTTDASATVLTSNGAAGSTDNQVILPNNSAYLFKATVISGVTGGGNTSGWKLEGVIKRGANAASTTIVGTVTTTLLAQDAGASTWTIAATADTTNGGLRFTFTGQASTTIRTVCKVETTEMTF